MWKHKIVQLAMKFQYNLDYTLKGFGYIDIYDLKTTLLKSSNSKIELPVISLSITLGIMRQFLEIAVGLDAMVVLAFVFLVIAETQTGIKASLKEGKKVQSKKIGRMILKIGVYLFVLSIINAFAINTSHLSFDGFELNPFKVIYYVVFVFITCQMIISYLENLGRLGYKEAGGAVGAILNKFNKWFEFDGEKNNDKYDQ